MVRRIMKVYSVGFLPEDIYPPVCGTRTAALRTTKNVGWVSTTIKKWLISSKDSLSLTFF